MTKLTLQLLVSGLICLFFCGAAHAQLFEPRLLHVATNVVPALKPVPTRPAKKSLAGPRTLLIASSAVIIGGAFMTGLGSSDKEWAVAYSGIAVMVVGFVGVVAALKWETDITEKSPRRAFNLSVPPSQRLTFAPWFQPRLGDEALKAGLRLSGVF